MGGAGAITDLFRRIAASVSGGNEPRGTRFLRACFHARVVLLRRDQPGFTLIEVLIALGILGAVGVGILSGLNTAFRAQDINREHVVAENLTRAVLEDIRFQSYQDSYTVTVPVPSGYSFTTDTQPYCTPQPCTPDNNLQRNAVTVLRGGQGVVTVEDLKVRR